MKRQKSKLHLSRLTTIIVVLVAVASVGGIIAYRQLSDKPTPPNNTNNIDLSPATEEEKKDSERRKDEVANNDTTPPPQPEASNVTPVIVDASQYDDQIEVRAYIPGIYEEGGTCTVTISKNSLKVTKQSTATKDATTTRCANISISRSEFQEAGQWSAIVSYSSAVSQGSSQPKSLEVK